VNFLFTSKKYKCMENIEKKPENIKNIESNKKSNTLYVVTIIILALMLGFVTYLYYNQKNQTDIIISQLNTTSTEKEQVNNELTNLLVQYESLKTDNEEINLKLEQEQEKIQELLVNLKKVKANNYYQIAQYKKELSTLREIMKSYIVQIDSLNTKNQILTAENTEIKIDYTKAVQHNTELQSENENLNEKVDIASVIKAINITAIPINKKSKSVTKAKKVNKVKVCFTLSENKIVESGNRTVYVRIARPDELILATSENNIFDFEGSKIIFTERRDVEYSNKPVNLCVYWKKDQELIPGTYFVDIFTDSKLIGEASFTLK